MRVLLASVSTSVFVTELVCFVCVRCICMWWELVGERVKKRVFIYLCAWMGSGFMPSWEGFFHSCGVCPCWNKEWFVGLHKALSVLLCVNPFSIRSPYTCTHTNTHTQMLPCLFSLTCAIFVYCNSSLCSCSCYICRCWTSSCVLIRPIYMKDDAPATPWANLLPSFTLLSFHLLLVSPLILFSTLMFHSACNYSHGSFHFHMHFPPMFIDNAFRFLSSPTLHPPPQFDFGSKV